VGAGTGSNFFPRAGL